MKLIPPYFSFLALLPAVSCQPSPQQPALVIATAANMQLPMESLTAAFTARTGIRCQITAGSSGGLAAQIREGAPYDVLVSADMKSPQAMHEEGFAPDPPRVYARGRLVLWTLTEGLNPSISSLSNPQIRHIALANPRTAPYGTAAMEVLTHHQLADSLSDQLVYGESISQTNQFILSGSADIGFTAMSTVLAPAMAGRGAWVEMDPGWYAPIRQGVVWLRRDPAVEAAARQFAEFLLSGQAAEILAGFGYLTGN